jgi:hypothetical protein
MDGGVDSTIRKALRGKSLYLDKREDDTGIFEHADAFVNLSRGNETVREVYLLLANDPSDDASGTQRYAIWDKIAEGVGNLQALHEIIIWDSYSQEDAWRPLAPDWQILACILRRLQRGIQLKIEDETLTVWDVVRYPEALPGLARVIRGQTMITGFSTGEGIPYHCLDLLCSILLTLPALENVSFLYIDGPDDGQPCESMIQLMSSSTLRQVKFEYIPFTKSLFQAIAKALKERSAITDLHFCSCSFPEGGGTAIASALTTNTTLKYLNFNAYTRVDEKVFYDVLAAVLLSNTTLQELAFSMPGRKCSWLSPLLLALQVNTGLKKLRISFSSFDLNNDTTLNVVREGSHTSIDERVSTAMRLGLGRNSTLESLYLSNISPSENDFPLWREAFSFLRNNTTLKALLLNFEPNVTESHAIDFRMVALAALRENKTLESLSMISEHATFDDYLVCVAAIQPNTTLKSLRLYPSYGVLVCVDQHETKELILVLKENYGLEAIPRLRQDGTGDICSILQLNQAGRCYLVQDGSSISKGVDVLGGVSNDINSVFLHLLENPRLCDRSAVEMPYRRSSDN